MSSTYSAYADYEEKIRSNRLRGTRVIVEKHSETERTIGMQLAHIFRNINLSFDFEKMEKR